MMDTNLIAFTIPFNPVTKKNHSRIATRYVKGSPRKMILPSEQFTAYQELVLLYMKRAWSKIKQIDTPVNVKAVYYMKTRGNVDLPNLHAALHDIMVKAELFLDDNCNIIFTTDGSYVTYDKANPRTEVEISYYTPGAITVLKDCK